MLILITGATGFIGKNLIKNIEKKHDIILFTIRYVPRQKITFNADVIIHLAGKAHDFKKANPKEYDEANFKLTRQLFDTFVESDAKIFIFMSTVKAVLDKFEGVLTEETDSNPKTPYGISKYKAEQYILNQDIPKYKKVYILRPSMVHGEGNKGNLNLLFKFVSKGIPWPLGKFENKRSCLSVDNLCFVIEQLLDREDIPIGVYNVADDGFISTNEIVELIAHSMGKRVKIWKISKWIIFLLAKTGNILHLPLNTERLNKLIENYEVSNKKIVDALGIPLPISVKEGLALTFKLFK